MENNPTPPKAYTALSLLRDVLRGLHNHPLTVLLIVPLLLFCLVQLLVAMGYKLASVAGKLHSGYRAFMHRNVQHVGLFGGLLVAIGVSYGLYLLDPNTPSLSVATLQVLCFAPILLFVVLHTTIYTYKHLLPTQFRAFVGQLGEQINSASLPPLSEILPRIDYYKGADDAVLTAQFKLKYHTTHFVIKCVRYVLFSLPFLAIFLAAKELLLFALNLQPHS